MGTRKTDLVTGEFYHLYNRGNSKQVIFQNDTDYKRFQLLLYLMNDQRSIRLHNVLRDGINPYTSHERGEPLVAIGAYCLMPNHYHLVVSPVVEDGVSQFMKKLGTAYSTYFNKRYERTGSLFEGKFKSVWADNDEYLRYLFSYVHLNPLKLVNPDWKEGTVTAEQLEFLTEFPFSSLYDQLSATKRFEAKILNRSPFPDYFSAQHPLEHILEWFNNRKDLAQLS